MLYLLSISLLVLNIAESISELLHDCYEVIIVANWLQYCYKKLMNIYT